MKNIFFRRFVLFRVLACCLLCWIGVAFPFNVSAEAADMPMVSAENLYSLAGNGSAGDHHDPFKGEIRGQITDLQTGSAQANFPVFAKQTSSFSVKLLDDSSRSLSQFQLRNTTTYQTLTAADGIYSLTDLPTGVYYVWAHEKNGPYLKKSYNSSQNQTGASLVFVRGGSTVDPINLSLQKGAKIEGKITSNFDGQGIEGVLLTILNPTMNNNPVGSAVSDQYGNYIVQGLPDGDYIAKVEKDVFVDSYYGGNEKPKSAVIIPVHDGVTVQGVDFSLRQSATVTGTIKNSADIGLTKIQVSIFEFDGQTLLNKALKNVQTDENGAYAIDKLPPGTYALRAEAPAVYLSAVYETEENIGNPSPLLLNEGQVINGINITLFPGGVIKGQVVNEATGEPVQKVQVKIVDTATGNSSGHAFTDSTGHYSIDKLFAGAYTIHTSSERFASKYYDNTEGAESATIVSLLSGSILDDINFSLVEKESPVPYSGSISGHITWEYDQSVIQGVCVQAATISPEKLINSACSNADGRYAITELPDGDYKIFAEQTFMFIPEFYNNIDLINSNDATIVSVLNGGQVDGINFVLNKTGQVTGTIFRDFDMQLIGTYKIIAVPGTYRVKVASENSGYFSSNEVGDERSVTIYDGQTTPAIDFILSVDDFLTGVQ